MNTKRCGGCQRDLPELFFATDRRSDDGLRSRCRECVSASRPARPTQRTRPKFVHENTDGDGKVYS